MKRLILLTLRLLIVSSAVCGQGCDAVNLDSSSVPALAGSTPPQRPVSPITLPNGEFWTGLTDPPPQTEFRTDHPRLLVTPESVPALREKLSHPLYARDVAAVRASSNGPDQAFCFLVWGDVSKGRAAIASLLAWDYAPWHSMERAAKRMQGVLMYDWLYNLMTPEEREQASELLMERINSGPDIRYFHSDHLTDHTYDHLLMALALDNEWAQSQRKELLNPAYRGFKIYHGLLDILTASALRNGGGWHAGNHSNPLGGYEGGFAITGALVLRAYETATGDSLFGRTTYMERMPYDILCSRMGIQSFGGANTAVRIAMEYYTGTNSPESAALAKWLLDKYKRIDGNPARIPRMILGDIRRPAQPPEQLGIPLHGYQDGANCVYVRSSWDDSATNFLFFARHWDRGRYEQESGQLVIHKAGKPILPLSTEAKAIGYDAFTTLRVFAPGKENRRQKSAYWNLRPRGNFPEDVIDPNRPEHRPETLVELTEENGMVKATTRFEQLLEVEAPIVQRSVTIDPQAETVLVEDYAELARGLKAEIWFGLREKPVIVGNVVETSTLKITVQSPFKRIYWDPKRKEINKRGSMWIKGTLRIVPELKHNTMTGLTWLEIK